MSRKLLILTLVLFGMFCAQAVAVAPLGPPAANLGKGNTNIGIGYTYSKMDLKFNSGTSPGGGPAFQMDDIKTHGVFIDVGRGFNDKWEAFVRIGAGSTRASDNVGGTAIHTHDPDSGYAVGFGTKWTFCQPREDLKFGGIFQILWSKVESEAKIGGNKWVTDTSMTEIQFAVGPDYQIRENVSLYGGASFTIVDGKFDGKRKNAAGTIAYDIDSGALFGGFIGTSIDINENAAFNIEWQHTSAMNLIGLKLILKFN